MKAIAWPCPAPGGTGEEFAVVAGPEDARSRVLIAPALFEEANKTRRLLAQVMRDLSTRGIASVLPDLPGCGESPAPLERQDLASWRKAMAAAARHFATTHVLSMRGGVAVAPRTGSGWRFEPIAARSQLRTLLRTRILAARDNGGNDSPARLLDEGRHHGLELAGYRLGPAMVIALEAADLSRTSKRPTVTVAELGGVPLWRNPEPDEDPALTGALAARIGRDIAS